MINQTIATIGFWSKVIPELRQIYDKAVTYMKENGNYSEKALLKTTIQGHAFSPSFNWGNTAEGHNYWRDLWNNNTFSVRSIDYEIGNDYSGENIKLKNSPYSFKPEVNMTCTIEGKKYKGIYGMLSYPFTGEYIHALLPLSALKTIEYDNKFKGKAGTPKFLDTSV